MGSSARRIVVIHGPVQREIAWRLLESGCALVIHNTRPAEPVTAAAAERALPPAARVPRRSP